MKSFEYSVCPDLADILLATALVTPHPGYTPERRLPIQLSCPTGTGGPEEFALIFRRSKHLVEKAEPSRMRAVRWESAGSPVRSTTFARKQEKS